MLSVIEARGRCFVVLYRRLVGSSLSHEKRKASWYLTPYLVSIIFPFLILLFVTTENYDEVIIAMMRNKADINAKNLNDSPLHIACINGNIGAVKVLIQRGAQLDMPST